MEKRKATPVDPVRQEMLLLEGLHRARWTLVPALCIGILAWGAGIVLWRGGSGVFPSAAGWDWQRNTLWDLCRMTGFDGAGNPARTAALLAQGALGAAMLGFFPALGRLLAAPGTRSLPEHMARFGIIPAVVGGAGMLGTVFLPLDAFRPGWGLMTAGILSVATALGVMAWSNPAGPIPRSAGTAIRGLLAGMGLLVGGLALLGAGAGIIRDLPGGTGIWDTSCRILWLGGLALLQLRVPGWIKSRLAGMPSDGRGIR